MRTRSSTASPRPWTYLVVFLALALGACTSTRTALPPRLEASTQPAGGSVVIDLVSSPGRGFVVVHATDVEGRPLLPASIGAAAIPAGESRAVRIELTEPARPGDRLVAMLHVDTGRPGVLEFGTRSIAEDKPLMHDGKPVIATIDVD